MQVFKGVIIALLLLVSGALAKLPRPADLLRVIARRGDGDDVLLHAIQHANELTDVDTCDAYLLSPLEYASRLRQLSEGAAEAHTRRLTGQAAATPLQVTLDGQMLAMIGAAWSSSGCCSGGGADTN